MIDLILDDFRICDKCFDCLYFHMDACFGWHVSCESFRIA